MSRQLIIFTDGGARGNPGPAAAGAVITEESGKILRSLKKYIGETTNNVAEYKALLLGLSEAASLVNDSGSIIGSVSILVKMDSELVVRQMQGRYKIKDPNLKLLAADVFKLLNKFKNVEFGHIPREQNKLADKLVNEAIDENSSTI
jgi:ribonuclease HI